MNKRSLGKSAQKTGPALAVVALGLLAALTGCGKFNRTEQEKLDAAGGVAAPSPLPSPTPLPPIPASEPEALSQPAGPAQDAEERKMLELINRHRAEHGRKPLRISPELTRAARWMSEDMALRSYLSHTDSQGRSSFDRMDAFGFDEFSARGENIASGNGAAERTFRQWLHSSGHNANMLSPKYELIGIARAYDAESRYGWYWTTDFGRESSSKSH